MEAALAKKEQAISLATAGDQGAKSLDHRGTNDAKTMSGLRPLAGLPGQPKTVLRD